MIRAAIPVLLLAVHAAAYGTWIVDDAGIVFAYARNVAAGFGFVAQPGDAAVEAVTNPMWMFALLPTFALDFFDPVVVPKVLGVAAAAVALLLVRRVARGAWPAAAAWVDAASIATAANPAFATWASSGLENGLTALLVATSVSVLVRAVERPRALDAVAAGGLGALMFFNRPDGGVYLPVFPLALLALGAGPMRRRALLAGVAVGVGAVGIGLVTLWRWRTFGELLPNTFYVKGGGTTGLALWSALHGVALAAAVVLGWKVPRSERVGLATAAAIAGLLFTMGAQGGVRALAGPLGWPLLAAALWVASRAPAADRPAKAFSVFTIAALVQFCALPRDWMGEFRFATPLVLLGTPAIAATVGPMIALRLRPRSVRIGVTIGLAVFLVGNYGRRAYRFAANPTVSMAGVEDRFRTQFVAWAEELGIADASIATPDVGGALWAHELHVYDLAGLCDHRVARVVHRDRAAVADIVLEDWKPTFVVMHGDHAWWSGLTDDPRFARDYVGVETWVDAEIQRTWGVDAIVGRFVRADVLTGGVTLERLRAVGR